MRNQYLIFGVGILMLVACTDTDIAEIYDVTPQIIAPQVIEQVPSELSIPHFGSMLLSGSSLQFERVLEKNEVYTKHAVSYRSNGLLITGVFLIPHGDGPFLLLIFNHGYIDPSIYTQGRGLKREEDYMARSGFAVFHTDYRGHAGSDKSPMVENVYDGNLEYAMDSVNAILAIREAKLSNVDAEHVGMLGHSLGGGVTLSVLTGRPDLLAAAVLYAPVHSDVWENFTRWRSKREEGDRTLKAFGTKKEGLENWERLSPHTYLKDINAPVLLVQGSADKDVPKEWSDFLNRELIKAKKNVEYVEYEGEGHEFSFQWQNFMKRTAGFFRENLIRVEFIPPMSPSRITKKPFGIFVKPSDSPIESERFTGIHTGVDFEVFQGEENLQVRASCTGKVLMKKLISGYGGVIVQSCTHNGEAITVLYGHMQLSSVKRNVGDTIDIGEPLGLLGRGFSSETDFERPHLHLGIHRGNEVAVKGYVDTNSDLADWIDAEAIF